MSVLPGEISDLVIDQVHYDQRDSTTATSNDKSQCQRVVIQNNTLACCALVCRSWLRRSRSLQYESLNFSHHPMYAATDSHRLVALADLLRLPALTIAPHVRQIALRLYKCPIQRSDLAHFTSFSYMESISLKGYYYSQTPLDGKIHLTDVINLLASLTNLKKLKLDVWMLESFEQLRDIICACRTLEELTLIDVDVTITPQAPSYKPRMSLTPPPLRVLLINDVAFEGQLVAWLASHPAAISSLTLSCGAFLHPNQSGKLLRRSGASLAHLQIHCASGAHGASCQHLLVDSIDLDHNTCLETLTLWAPIGCLASSLVTQISSPHIQEINIDTGAAATITCEHISSLRAIDAMVQRPNFAHLAGLNVLNALCEGIADDWLHHTTPLCAARGIAHLVKYQELGRLWAVRSGGRI